LISPNCLVNVSRREFIKFLVVTKDDDRDIDGAEHGKLMRLLEQPTLPLEKSSVESLVNDCLYGRWDRVGLEWSRWDRHLH
jgi:hypothetical protein